MTAQAHPAADASLVPILVQRVDVSAGEHFDAHVHDVHQLVWASQGALTVAIGDDHWVLPRSLALWVPAGIVHATGADSAAIMHGAYVEVGAFNREWREPTVIAVNGLIGELIELLGDDGADDTAQGHARQLLFALMTPVPVLALHIRMPTDPRVRRVVDGVLADLTDNRTLAAWGRDVGASTRTLTRLFAAETGTSFGQWRTQARLRAALELLAAGSSVKRVAADVGYCSPSSFIAAFRAATGATPGTYFSDVGRSAAVLRA